MKTNQSEGASTLFKVGFKFRLLAHGTGMLGGVSVLPLTVREVQADGNVVAAPPRSRCKTVSLTRLLRANPCLILSGHEKTPEPLLDIETGKFVIGGGFAFVDSEQSVSRLADRIKTRLVAHTLGKSKEIGLVTADWTTRPIRDELLALLPPDLETSGFPVQAPPHPSRVSLLTDAMKRELLKADGKEPTVPLYKIFMPDGVGTWLLCSMDADMDTLWAVCDIGQGCVEFGTVSLTELETVRSRGGKGMHCERDKWFDRSRYKDIGALLEQSSIP